MVSTASYLINKEPFQLFGLFGLVNSLLSVALS